MPFSRDDPPIPLWHICRTPMASLRCARRSTPAIPPSFNPPGPEGAPTRMLYEPPTQISERLRHFTAGLPGERNSLLQFALRVAAELEPDSRLLDVGAGDGPYRELFDH